MFSIITYIALIVCGYGFDDDDMIPCNGFDDDDAMRWLC